MPRKNLCEIVVILDRSGSMESVRQDAIGGFNTFMDDQKQVDGEARVTLVQFDNEYETVFENTPIHELPTMDENTFVPRGTTALLYAVGRTIDEVGKRLDATPEDGKPEKVMVAILTDGFENASHNMKPSYDNDKIKQMIDHQKSKYGWEFIFLAAGVDAWSQGGLMGIPKADCFTVAANAQGIQSAYTSMSVRTTAYRKGDKAGWSNFTGDKVDIGRNTHDGTQQPTK